MNPAVIIHVFQKRFFVTSKKGSLLPANLKQTNIEQKSNQEQILSTPPMLTPKQTLNNSNVINIDNNETLPIPNDTL